MADTWRQCNICKNPIAFEQTYYVCSVSTCNRKRTGLVFCSPACFDAHLPMMRHRDAWAEEEKAPTRAQAAAEAAAEESSSARPERRVVTQPRAPAAPKEILIVASKLKKFIKDQASMNTSDNVMGVLSDHLRELSVEALRVAAQEGRKTVLDRDFEVVLTRLKSKRESD
jgi:histone H3/H4